MVPAIAVALVVVGSAMALVFDRLWQDAAAVELRTAGEAAALAAAAELASDDTLRKDADPEAICQTARTAAAEIARQNLVGGQPVKVWDAADGDVEIGQLVTNNTGEQVFVRTAENPDRVLVHVEQGRGPSNPVGLLVRDLTGAGRLLRTTVEAKIERTIAGVRPWDGVNTPVVPLAISGMSPTGWNAAIDGGTGTDALGFSRESSSVTAGPDSITEMTALSAPQQASTREQLVATLHAVDFGTGLAGDELARECRDGLSLDDLRKHGGELRIDGKPLRLPSTPKLPGECSAALKDLIGQTRICLVYDSMVPGSGPDQWTVTCGRLVAIRILAVQQLPDGLVAVQVQPAVVSTRTAIVVDDDDSLWNPFVCKVSLGN